MVVIVTIQWFQSINCDSTFFYLIYFIGVPLWRRIGTPASQSEKSISRFRGISLFNSFFLEGSFILTKRLPHLPRSWKDGAFFPPRNKSLSPRCWLGPYHAEGIPRGEAGGETVALSIYSTRLHKLCGCRPLITLQDNANPYNTHTTTISSHITGETPHCLAFLS